MMHRFKVFRLNENILSFLIKPLMNYLSARYLPMTSSAAEPIFNFVGFITYVHIRLFCFLDTLYNFTEL